ncbi:unnamed protein product [Symbiodinium sp. CCMP2592]|nr:unnamed protein product [Symbiodinium sp. CCMP2592]
MTDMLRGIEVELLDQEGVPLPKHRDVTADHRTYVIASPNREYTIEVRSPFVDCLATASVEGHRVLCNEDSFLPVWRGKSRTFQGFETQRVVQQAAQGSAMDLRTTYRPFVFTVPEGQEDAETSALRCVEVELFRAEKELVPWHRGRAACVQNRVDNPTRPMLATHERKNYEVSGEEPIATRPGDPVTTTRRAGGGYLWQGNRKMREKLKKGDSLGRIVIHYVGFDQASRLRPLPRASRAEPAPSWAGAHGAAPADDSLGPRVVVDAPNVARYFAAGGARGRLADLDPFVLEGVLDDIVAVAPDVVLVLVFSIASAAGLNVGRLRDRYPGRLTLRCCSHGEDPDEVALQAAAAPGSRGCILSNDHFQDYVDRGIVSANWLSGFRMGFEISDDSTTFLPPAPHQRLPDFLAALQRQGQVLGSAGADPPQTPSPAAQGPAERSSAREEVGEGEEALGVEEYALQRALEHSMSALDIADADLDWAIAASLAEQEEAPAEELFEMGGLMVSEEEQLRWATEASLTSAFHGSPEPQPV